MLASAPTLRVRPRRGDGRHRHQDGDSSYRPPPAGPCKETECGRDEDQTRGKPQKTDQWRNRLGQLPELGEAEGFREAEQMNQAMTISTRAKSRAMPSCDERTNDAATITASSAGRVRSWSGLVKFHDEVRTISQ